MLMLMQLLDLLEHKSIFTAGYKAVLHIHSLVEECEITKLISIMDMKTKTQKKASLQTSPFPPSICFHRNVSLTRCLCYF